MQAILAVIVIVVLAFVGYQYLYRGEEPPATARQAAETAREAAQQAGQALTQAGQALTQGAQQMGQAVQEQAQGAGQALRQQVEETRGAVAGGTEVGRELSGALNDLRTALGNITDPAKVQDALPSLEGIETRLAGLQERAAQLPAEARNGIAGLINQSLPGLKGLAEQAGNLEGGERVKPTLQAIIARLEAWAKTPA